MADSGTIPARSAVLRRSFRKGFPAAVRGEGVYVWDADGNRYLDLAGSAAVNFIGHGVPEISAAMAEQAAKLEFVHTSQFTTPVAEEYAEELLAFAGENFRAGAVYFTCGGSESIETALKLARQYQVEIGQASRYQILSRQQSYHGSTLGALSVSGNKRRREMYLPMVREFAHVGMPYCYRCDFDCTDGCRNCGQQYAAELEHAIEASRGEAAAFIFEPVSGATLGAVVPPPGYLQSIADICHRHGVLLIADEVMTGMGRTGRNFAVEHNNVAPDILVTAKGLSLLQAKKQVEAADSSRPGTTAAQFKKALEALRAEDTVGDVRGIGLLWAVEFVADKASKRPFAPTQNFAGSVAAAALKRGLLVYPMQGSVDGISGDHLLVAPPAIITHEQIAWSVEQLRAAVRRVFTSF